jgi:hypothetical protein
MRDDEPYLWDLYEKKENYVKPAAAILSDGTEGGNAPLKEFRTLYNSGELYSKNNRQEWTSDQLRHSFKRYTYMNCVAENDLVLDLSLEGYDNDPDSLGLFAIGSGPITSADFAIDYVHPGLWSPSECEALCRYNDECVGFQLTSVVMSDTQINLAAHSTSSLNGEPFIGSTKSVIFNGKKYYCQFFDRASSVIDEEGVPTCPVFNPSFNDTAQFYDKSQYVNVGAYPAGAIDPGGTQTFSQKHGTAMGIHAIRRPTVFVQKIPAPMCTATVSNLPPESKAFEGEYVKSGGPASEAISGDHNPQTGATTTIAYSKEVYEENLKASQWDKIDNSATLVFKTDTTANCDYWELHANEDFVETTLEVCVDFPEAAAAYLAMTPPIPYNPDTRLAFPVPGNITFGATEFPCQTGVDNGFCDNMVFAGLCPYSCGEERMEEFTEDRGPREEYMLWHKYVFEEPGRTKYYKQKKTMYEENERFLALFGDDSCDDGGAPGAPDGFCFFNCTSGPFGKLTDCTDCLGATSLFCKGQTYKAALQTYLADPVNSGKAESDFVASTSNPLGAGVENTRQKSKSECGKDNNVAMMFFAIESDWIDEVNARMAASTPPKVNTLTGAHVGYTQFIEEMHQACANVISLFNTYADYPCKENPRMDYRIVNALCPAACSGDPPEAPSPLPPNGETDPSGATRQLGDTVSWSGKMTGLGKLTASYTHTYPKGPVDASKSRLIYRTYAKDSLVSSSWYHGTCTSNVPLDTATKTAAAFDLLDDCWYKTDLMDIAPSDLTVQEVCRGVSVCPELMTCVMKPSRFHDELHYWRYSVGLTRQTHLMQLDSAAKDNLFSTSHFMPKVITTGERVEAIMTATTLSYFPSIHRAEPGAMRLTIVDEASVTVTGQYLVVVLFKPEKGDVEGGHLYELPASEQSKYSSSWLSDVIRIERFAADTTPLESGLFTMDLDIDGFVPASLSGPDKQEIDVFRFPPVAGAPPVSIKQETGFSIGLTPDGSKIRLTVPKIDGDLVLIQDKNECASSPCDPIVGICQNEPQPPGYTCSCPSTHVCVGGNCNECRMKTDSLPDYYVVLSHTSRLDYGWRVKQVKFYAKEDCTGAIPVGKITGPTSLADHGLGTEKSYPGAYAPSNVGALDKEWWSSCITCNPDEMYDGTHGGPAQLEWTVDGDQPVGCVEVLQGSTTDAYGGHASRGLKVERGPTSRASPACGGASLPRCQATMTVTATCGDTDDCTSTQLSLGCGKKSTLLWGEILEPAGTEAFGFYGSYGKKGGVADTILVPSSCHCHELCILHTKDGCRSYKFFMENALTHCVLQTSEFFTYTAGVAAPPPGSSLTATDLASYTSGTPMDRFASSGSGARVLEAAKPWVESFSFADGVISVHGYGLPTKNSVTKADRGRYQRVKIVTRGAACSSAVPSAVSGIGCVSTLLKSYAQPHQKTDYAVGTGHGTNEQTVYTVCSTRPSSWTAETVMWDGISISAGSLDKSYDVCYCDGTECSRPESWIRVPPLSASDGVILMGNYLYTATAQSVSRGGSVDVTVTGPTYGTDPSSGWTVKAVPSHFACSVSSTFVDSTPTVVSVTEATFTLSFASDSTAVGEFTICLSLASGGAFSALASTISVVPLSTDRTHAPLGAVYREQRWSALTGGPKRELSLKGTKLPSVSDSKVVLSHGTTCAWPDYSFGGAVTRQPTTDTTPPTVVWGSTVPASGAVVSASTTVKVVFDEPLSEPADCLGGYTLKKVTGSPGSYTVVHSAPSYFIACDAANKTIIDNFVLLEFDPAPAAGMYALFFDSYTIADLDGNSMFLAGSLDESTGAADWVYEIGTDATAPVMVTSEPKLGLITGTGIISLTFSEPVVPVLTGYADLVDCGDDFVCDLSVDPMIAKYKFDDPLVTLTNISKVFSIDLTSIVDVYNYKRYSLTFAAGSFKDDFPAENPSPQIVLEFLKDASAAFDMANALAPSSSTVDGLKYELELTTPPGTYSICYCDAQTDATLFDAGDGKTTAKPTFGKKAAGSTSFTDVPVGSRALSAHVCMTKCAAGCVGDDCFCSGFDETAGDMSTVYCLSPVLCRSACDDLGAACAGFGTKGTDSCVLYTSGYTLSTDGAWTSYAKETGTACTDPYEFSTLVGKATVTARADVYVEYVVEPNVVTTLEVAGTSMISMKAGMPLSLDRIMVVDCDGMCGYSSPSASVVIEGFSGGWNELKPLQWGVDKPTDMPELWKPLSWTAHSAATGNYETVPSAFCASNLQISSLSSIPMEGFSRKPTVHLCYNKCIAQDCVGDDCFCGGAYTGYDTADSNALCADEALCKHLCDSYEGCKSIDMAKDKTRCFLNADTCDATDSKAPVPDMNYNLLIKVIDQGSRMLESGEPTAEANERSLLPAKPSGYSHSKLLIFEKLKFTSGGTFKVCFCDSTLRGDEGCTSPEHYGVEVGEVQASGISCLLTNSLFNRKTCVPMGSVGALRCYSGTPPDTDPPKYADVQPDEPVPGSSGPGEPVASTYCRLHPELCR